MKISIAFVAASAAVLLAAPAFAQTDAPSKCPAGDAWAAVRISRITGTREGFDKAVHDHIKWYRDHGYNDNTITVGPVMETTDKGMTSAPSKDELLSIHLNDPQAPLAQHDDAWRAYVAEYRANSAIVSETYACLPVGK